MANTSEVPRGCICRCCFRNEICICNICKCQHLPVGSDYVCPDKHHIFLERKKGKGAMSQTIADRVYIRLDTRVLRYGKGGSFIDELKALKEQVAQLTLENEELRRFKAAVEAKEAADTQSATDA